MPVRLRIGLLGGSFNPAHEGHLHISMEAKRHLALDQLWWLVSPQNPLKPTNGMAPYKERLAQSEATASPYDFIQVSDFEQKAGTRYTVDTISALKTAYPDKDFVWVIGADNLVQMNKWHAWERLFQLIPIAVFDRPGYTQDALQSVAAGRFAKNRVASAKDLMTTPAPAWSFVEGPTNPASSTELRDKLMQG